MTRADITNSSLFSFPPTLEAASETLTKALGRFFLLVILGLDKLEMGRPESWKAEATCSESDSQLAVEWRHNPGLPKSQPGVLSTLPHSTGASGCTRSRSWMLAPA